MKISDKTVAIVIFIVFGVLSLLFLSFFTRIKIMKGNESLIPPNDPALVAMKKMEKEFGNASQIMIIVKTNGIFKRKNSVPLYHLVQKLKEMKGVKSVQSIFDAANVKFSFLGLKYQFYFKKGIPTSTATKLLDSKLYTGNLVDPSGKVVSVIVYLKNGAKNVTSDIKKTLKRMLPSDMKYYLTGEDVVNAVMDSSIFILSLFYPPFLFGLMWLLYFLRLGNVMGAAIPPLLAALAAMWTYGMAGMIGFPLNVLTSMVGMFVIVVSSSYGLHFLDRYMFNRARMEHHAAVVRTIKEESIPVIMSALTTVVGFITFVFTGIEAFRTFGILVSTGVGISALFTIVLIPAITNFFDIHKRTIPTLKLKMKLTPRFNKFAIFATIALLVLSPIFIMRINVDSNEFGYFKYNSNVRRSAQIAKKYFGWVLPLYVMVGKKHPFTQEDSNKLEDFISQIEKIPHVSGVNSVLGVSKAFHIPLPILQTLSKDPRYASYFSEWFYKNTTRLFVKTPLTDTNGTVKVADDIKKIAKRFPHYDISVTSPALTYAAMNSSITKNQISTIIMAFFFILILLIITFRGFIPPLIASIPIILTVVFNFTLMGVFGVNLEVSTAIISSVLMGLVIDYSIHTISRYRMSKDIGKVVEEVGPVIVVNALGLIAGFATLLFAPLRLYMQIGGLLSLGIAIGAFLTIVFVIELLRLYDKRLKLRSHKQRK